MCRFCVEHGDGERWYLQVRNYAYDLDHDLRRRQYIVGFISEFGESRERALAWSRRLDALPAPLSRVGKAAVSRHMQRVHFGQPVPLEECERILGLATSITVIPCICRMHTPGKCADDVCVLVTTQPIETLLEEGFRDYVDGPGIDDFQRVRPHEAMRLLRRCEQDGLMHSVWTFQTPFTAAICNCNLESGCLAMRLTAGYGVKLMWRGEWTARLDVARCNRCGECVRVCPFGAISSNGCITLHRERCWGCGICRTSCAHDAISLNERSTVPGLAEVW